MNFSIFKLMNEWSAFCFQNARILSWTSFVVFHFPMILHWFNPSSRTWAKGEGLCPRRRGPSSPVVLLEGLHWLSSQDGGYSRWNPPSRLWKVPCRIEIITQVVHSREGASTFSDSDVLGQQLETIGLLMWPFLQKRIVQWEDYYRNGGSNGGNETNFD